MNSNNCLLTVITPTIGRPGLIRLIESISKQTLSHLIYHIILWDDFREIDCPSIDFFDGPRTLNLRLSDGFGKNGNAPGSPLRAVGLMAAITPWVTFADDDVVWDNDHVESLFRAAHDLNWASSLRRIVSPDGIQLGIDNFESVGDDPSRLVSYEMIDGNCMIFRRELGVQAASLFRETKNYDDDRRLYKFLKNNGGQRGKTNEATITQICPINLVNFFKDHCTKE